jgi:metal-responsive CopG/Arc/MetJ family transcriptional regulator
MPSDKPRILFVMDKELLDRIDDFRFSNRINSRSETVRRLVDEALSKYEKQEKKPKK